MRASPVPCLWTLADAAAQLDPPIAYFDLKAIVHALHIVPAGVRRNTRRDFGPEPPGRPPNVYDAATLQRLHAALLPWLTP